jgi:hypothetical protein
MLTFRTSITSAVVAFIVALAALRIAIQARAPISAMLISIYFLKMPDLGAIQPFSSKAPWAPVVNVMQSAFQTSHGLAPVVPLSRTPSC